MRLASRRATAQTQSLPLGSKVITTQVTEWDLPYPTDARPGAMASDLQSYGGNKLWFVTRIGITQRRLGSTAWPSGETSSPARRDGIRGASTPRLRGPTGGVRKLKPSYDRRFVFVHTRIGAPQS